MNDSAVPQELVNDTSFFGQPRGLGTLFFVEMWERFSFYGLRPLLVLFMTTQLMSGGWVADRWLGLQNSVWYGGIIIALGHLSIGLSAALGRMFFFGGLVLIVIGTGLLKPNISAMVGEMYPQGGARRDAGFSIYYM